jgi:carboxy-cis,cis-muconate cyclase
VEKHNKKTIYGAAMKKWSSYTVNSPTEIVHTASHPMEHDRKLTPGAIESIPLTNPTALAASKDTNTRAIFVLAAQQAPYNVYGNPFYDHAGFGNNFSVNAEGVLDKCVQNYEYMPKTGIHGMVFDASETYLYSADLRGNKIWTHKKDEQGQLTLVGCLEAPDPLDHPRWVALHQNYLYVLMEAGNRLGVYVIDEQTHCPTFTHITYPLIPPGTHWLLPDIAYETHQKTGIPNSKTMYRSDVVFLSHSKKYLFATSRANAHNLTGYIAAFKLGPAGNIERQICLNPTPTSGGHSNAVSPCHWSDEWLALTDDQDGWIEIYRWKDEFLGRVAHCDVKEPGFGMNAIWYD